MSTMLLERAVLYKLSNKHVHLQKKKETFNIKCFAFIAFKSTNDQDFCFVANSQTTIRHSRVKILLAKLATYQMQTISQSQFLYANGDSATLFLHPWHQVRYLEHSFYIPVWSEHIQRSDEVIWISRPACVDSD